MKKIDLSAVSNSAGFPVTKTTWEHLQDAYEETIDALSRAMVGPNLLSNNGYVLYGCEKTVMGSDVKISAGAIYWQRSNNGQVAEPEIYLCDDQIFTNTSSSTSLYGKMQTFYHQNDPVSFTDYSTNTVHAIRKVVWSTAINTEQVVYNNLLRCKPSFVQMKTLGWVNPIFDFRQDQMLFYYNTPSNTQFNIDFKNAVPGVQVKFVLKSQSAPTYSAPANVKLIPAIYPTSTANLTTRLITLTYHGSDGTDQYISIKYES